MSTNLVAFDSVAGLPAFLKADAGAGNLAAFMGGASFDSLSIKGKVFHHIKNGEKTLLTKPGGDGEPAASVEVVILDIAPRGKLSARTFYLEKYAEGSTEAPDCMSNDGVSPDADAKSPQANKCAVCKNNVKGSGATPTNPEGKACSSSKRLAVATPDNLDEPMFLRVPGDSIVPLGDYINVLKNRSVPNSFAVVTKVGFDYTVPHPKLTFKPVAFVSVAQYAKAGEVAAGELVQQIIGIKAAPLFEGEETPPVEVPAEKPKAAEPAPKAAAKPKTVVKVEGEDEPAPAPKAAAKKAVAEPKVVAEPVDEGLSNALDDLDFDD